MNRRLTAGLVLAAVVLLGGAALLVRRSALRGEERREAERTAMVSLRALADVVESASLPTRVVGEELPAPAVEPEIRRAVQGFVAGHPEVRTVRVLLFDGLRLIASNAAPRRLSPQDKPLYDLAQQLRRQPRPVVLPAAGRRMRLAAPLEPLEHGLQVAGLVELVLVPVRSPLRGRIERERTLARTLLARLGYSPLALETGSWARYPDSTASPPSGAARRSR